MDNEIHNAGMELFSFLDEYKMMDKKRVALEDKIKKYMIDNKITKINFEKNSLVINVRNTKKLIEDKVPLEHRHYLEGKMYIMSKTKSDPFD